MRVNLVHCIGLLALCLFSQGHDPLAQERLIFDHLSVEDGLSQNSVQAILQDQYGYLWIGTQDGLDRYDGYDFISYRQDSDSSIVSGSPGLTSNTVWSLYEDGDGTLWVGTGGGLNRLDRQSGMFFHYRHDPEDSSTLSHATVRAMAEDGVGGFWVGTSRGGLNRMDRDSGVFTHYRHSADDADSISSDRISSIVSAGNGVLWVGTDDGGVNRIDASTGEVVRYRHDPDDPGSLSSDKVTALLLDRDNVLWVGTDDAGLNRLDPDDTFRRFRHDPLDSSTLSSNSLRSLYEDSEGRLWVGHYLGGGLDLFDRDTGTFQQFDDEPGVTTSLSDDHVLSMHEDAGGVLWFGTHVGGLNKYDRKRARFQHFQNEWWNENSLSDSTVRSFLRHENKLYIGTEGGLNVMDLDTGEFSHYRHNVLEDGGLPHNIVRYIDMDADGNLWLATHGGLSRFDPDQDTFRTYRHDPDDPTTISSDTVWRLHVDSHGAVWAGARNALNRMDPDTGRFQRFWPDPDDPASLPGDRILAIHETGAGEMWFSTVTTGISRFDPETDSFTNYRHVPGDPESLVDDTVFVMAEDRVGTLWVGSRGGLSRFDPETESFTHYTEQDGLANNSIYGILFDQEDRIWVSTNRGVSRFDPISETFLNFGTNDGLQGDEFNNGAYHQGPDGEMYFGGVNGFNIFHPDDIQRNTYAPPVVVTRMQVLNEPRPVSGSPDAEKPITLGHRENYISFEFAALDFSAPRKLRYSYRLDGFDANWIDAGARRYASYTNLPPGDYIFRVRGTNSDGLWSDQTAALAVTVVPAFWQTLWFRATLLLAVMLLGVALYRYKTLRIHRRNQELEVMVADRTAQLQRINDGLESEVEQRKRAEDEIRQLAFHDYLTGLPNRRLFTSLCEQVVSSARRQGHGYAVLYMDIDLFKEINDQWGHEAGDTVLKAVASRARAVLRQSDIICRVGGDEFVLLLGEVSGAEAVRNVARKLATAISIPVGIPVTGAGEPAQVIPCVSIGISLYPDDADSLDELLSRADRFMYQAKRSKASRASCAIHNGEWL